MKEKLKIIAYGFVGDDRTNVRIYTEDGGVMDARRCPTQAEKNPSALFCDREGQFYRLTRFGIRPIKPSFCPAMQHHKGGSTYPVIRANQTGDVSRNCHLLMWETWVGARTLGMEIDHINGNKMDWRLCNLEEVTPEENRKRARLLRVLRSIGREPREMSSEELLNIFKRYEFEDPAKRMEYEMSHHCEE